MSTLELRWRHRESGSSVDTEYTGPFPIGVAGGIPERDWLDFVIDGQSLADLLGLHPNTLISFLGWMETSSFASSSNERMFLEELLLDRSASLDSERIRLYVCSVCGHDIGCGAVTAAVMGEPTIITWSQFGFEQDPPRPDEPTVKYEGFESIGPFSFERDAYRRVLKNWPTKEQHT